MYGEEDILYGTLTFYLGGETVEAIAHTALDCQCHEYDASSELWHRTGGFWGLSDTSDFAGTLHLVQCPGRKYFALLLNQKHVDNILEDLSLCADVKILDKFVAYRYALASDPSTTLSQKIRAFDTQC